MHVKTSNGIDAYPHCARQHLQLATEALSVKLSCAHKSHRILLEITWRHSFAMKGTVIDNDTRIVDKIAR